MNCKAVVFTIKCIWKWIEPWFFNYLLLLLLFYFLLLAFVSVVWILKSPITFKQNSFDIFFSLSLSTRRKGIKSAFVCQFPYDTFRNYLVLFFFFNNSLAFILAKIELTCLSPGFLLYILMTFLLMEVFKINFNEEHRTFKSCLSVQSVLKWLKTLLHFEFTLLKTN